MGSHCRALGLALGMIGLASCAGSELARNAASPQAEPELLEAAMEPTADELAVTGSRQASPQIQASPQMEKHMRESYAIPAPPPPIAPPAPWGPHYKDVGRDRFTAFEENRFRLVREAPVSTFSIDVDTASYAWVRASLAQNVLPQPAAVRTEEMINYFRYDYAAPRTAAQPFSTNVALFPSPFTRGRQLVRIGIKGYAVEQASRPRANLVFLIDTSGSMNAPNKLPLVKQSLAMLLEELGDKDMVAIVTYAGGAGVALEPTSARNRDRILAVIDRLGARGSTAGAEGIRQAYELAKASFDAEGVNRVILATDGDFNVGITDQNELKGYIERERENGIFLSVLGFGMGNYNDALMQTLAQNGNGIAAYIDTVAEARKTLVEEASANLFPIAKDVKIQVEFNPAAVAEYRLIGYETRALNREDFDNDRVDAGDVGSGQSVTALYEIIPVGGPRTSSDLRYADGSRPSSIASRSSELGFVKIRYKLPKSDRSRLISTPIDRRLGVSSFDQAPRDARFATAVAGFAELLRGGRNSGALGYDDILRIAEGARGPDEYGLRAEFIQLVRTARGARSMARLDQ